MQEERSLISFGIAGGQQTRSSPVGVFGAIGQFLNACDVAPAAGPAAPQQPQPLPMAPQQPQPLPMAPQQPNAGAISQAFTCDDGSALALSVAPAGRASIANVVLGDGTQYALISVPSPVGTKYSNGAATLVVNGNSAQWTAGGASRFCAAQ